MDEKPIYYQTIDVPVIDGVATLPDGRLVKSSAKVVRVPYLTPEDEQRLVEMIHGPAPDSLDAAWAEAEAALLEGWAILQLHHTAMMDQRWQAEAQCRVGPVVAWNKVRTVIAEGPSPAAALRALTAKLREVGR